MSHPEYFPVFGKEVRSTEIFVVLDNQCITRCEAPQYVAIFRCFAPRDTYLPGFLQIFRCFAPLSWTVGKIRDDSCFLFGGGGFPKQERHPIEWDGVSQKNKRGKIIFVFRANEACSEEHSGDYRKAGAQKKSYRLGRLEADTQERSKFLDQVQTCRQFVCFQPQSGHYATRNGTWFGHFEDTMAEMPPHQVGAKPILAEQQCSTGAIVAGCEKRPGMAATRPCENGWVVGGGCHDFTDSVATAIRTRRTEHHLALEKQSLFASTFRHHRRLKMMKPAGIRRFVCEETCFHGL
jgi:hypothetical protein